MEKRLYLEMLEGEDERREREIEIERLYQKLEHVRGSGINITK